jgi:putative phosphoribosyl transferase
MPYELPVHAATRPALIPLGNGAALSADLTLPEHPEGLVLFAHGSGSGRLSPRNRTVADVLVHAGLGTLLVDLLTEQEAVRDAISADLRFDIDLLRERVVAAVDWAEATQTTRRLPLGLFGASTGAAAALAAAADRPALVKAVVSRGGRPDLAGALLPSVSAPTLLIVGSRDADVLELNRRALAAIPAVKRLEIVAGASHLFEEPGALEQVAELASSWFRQHVSRSAHSGTGP